MTREQEMLARAMNFVDDEYIASAHAGGKKLRHALPLMIAACLVVVLIAVFPTLQRLINVEGSQDLLSGLPPAPGSPNEIVGSGSTDMGHLLTQSKPDVSEPPPTIGDTVTLGENTVTMTAFTDTTATLRVIKRDATPLHVAFCQWGGGYLASTQPSFRDGNTILREGQIKVYVNGATEPTALLPTAPGEYEITVNFATLRNGSYVMQNTMIVYTCTGKEVTVKSQWFAIDPALAGSEHESVCESEA